MSFIDDEIEREKQIFIIKYYNDLNNMKCFCGEKPRYCSNDSDGDFLCEDCMDQCFWEYKNDE